MEFFNPNSNFDFLGARRISVGISVVLMLLSVAALGVRGLNYALDFTGGVLIEAKYEQPVAIDQVRSALDAGGFHNAQVQSLGGTRDVSIRLQPEADQKNADEIAGDVMRALQTARPDASLSRHDFVGPQVGQDLKNDGIVAAVFVMIGIMIYIAVRFEKRFAYSAILSEFHDVVLTVGFIAATGIEFDLTVLAAILAIIGYSINDKVVVFDRARELFRLTRKGTPLEVLNRSINQTLSRTIMTSFTTALTMFVLWWLGGPAVHNFASVMLFGVVVGTLSSIFFANPLLYWLGVSKADLMPVTKDDPELARRP